MHSQINSRKILLSLASIGAFAALVAGATGAFFSDAETASGNTFAAGVIDLTVDNESYYNGAVSDATTWLDPQDLDEGTLFFDFEDLKPDDEGEDTISLHVGTNEAWACMDVTLTSNDDNTSNEPELDADDEQDVLEDTWDGELAQNIDFVWWADDGDNVLEDDENILTESSGVETLFDLASTSGPFSVALTDSADNVWSQQPNDPLNPEVVHYVAKGWCFGDMTLDQVAQDNEITSGPLDGRGTGFTCDGTTLGNDLQTDRATLDVSFRTMQARHDSEFLCNEPETPPLACTPEQTWADVAVSNVQGLRKNGTAVLANRSDTDAATGPSESSGNPVDNPGPPAGTFYALGFSTQLLSANVVLDFSDNVVVDEAGPDLKLWEVTGNTTPPYPDEHVKVELSNNLVIWIEVAADVTRDGTIDLDGSGVTAARYVRITDINDPIAFPDAEADGYDLDAVQALNCVVSPIQ